MKLTNNQIYQYAQNLSSIFDNDNLYIPVKANFLIQKNINLLAAAGQEIEKARLDIAKHYGELEQEKMQYKILPENMEVVNKELNDLFSIEQELEIRTFDIEALGNAEFTPAQMQAIMFMIED